MRRNLLVFLLFLGLSLSVQGQKSRPENVVVAYVTSWSRVMPDPFVMTHINYAFGGVTPTFDGVTVNNPDRLKAITALKRQNPKLKVLLSVGGWGAGRFSEMVTDPSLRMKFCNDCRRVVEEFGLDGIDIDWEYPGNPGGGISYAKTDKDNFTLLMRDLRSVLGKDRLVTLATAAMGEFYDFPAFMPYVDFVNMMTYDMGGAPQHHAPLFNSENFTHGSCDKARKAHIEQGVPAEKLVLGLPFYGRGLNKRGSDNFCDYNKIITLKEFKRNWDKTAKEPYLTDKDGNIVMGYDDAESLSIKCKYAKKNKLRGVMYWDYNGDDAKGTLSRAVWKAMK